MMADVDEDSDIDECSGISQPTLLEQIRTILDDYRNDVQIIKELIQNADDAGASEMKLLYIETELNKDVVQNENVLKGPALVVYNNAKFTEQDWRGITSIYSSVKRNDPLKVGRFGLGFKSVFHMTDNPCIISDCNILFINPLEKENDKVCVQVKLKHLKKSKRLDFSNIMTALNGIFEFSESTISDGIYPGTLFWFSLRQRPSELSSDIYDKEQVNGILGAFSEESSRSLIFLKTLCKVDVFVLYDSDQIPNKRRRTSLHNSCYGQRKHYLSTSIYNTDANEPKSLVEKRKETLVDMEKIGMSIPKKPSYWLFDVIIETMSSLHGDHSKTTKSRWVIILYHKGEPIRNETQLLLKEKDLQYSPLVGLAAPINETGDYTNIISHVFCYQPLPQENASGTGIPVYVNAFFALGQNRRQIRWSDLDKKGEEIVTDDIKIKWNKALRTEFLPYAYVQLCCELVRLSKTMKNDKHFVQAVYNVIPNLKLSEGHWKHLAEEVVKLIEDVTTIFTESKDGVWIKPSEANLIDKEEFSKLGKFGKETQDTVFTLLRKDNKNVSDVPHNVMYSLRKIHSDKLTFVTPRLLKQHLNENASYTSLSFNEKVRLMKFILQDDSSDLLENLELVPLADTSFTTFSGGQVFLENSDVIKLFPGKEMKFVYGDLDENSKQRLGQLLEKDECSVSYMNDTDTRNLLKVILNERFDNQHGCYRVEDQWLKEVWSLIQNKYMEQIDSFADLHLFPIYRKIGKNDSAVEKVIPINSLIYVKPAQTDASIVNLFRYLSVYVVQNVPRCIDERVIERYIYRDTLEDLQSLFGKVADPDIDVLNKHISTSDSNMFLGFLSERMQKNSGRIKHKLENMKLFLSGRQRDKCSLRCIAECQKLYKGQSLPIPFPVDVIFLNNETQIRFAESIGGQVTSDYDMVLFTLERIDTYSPLEKDKLIKWVLQSHFLDKNDVQIFLKSISFVPTKGGQLHKASELFDPEDKCLATFVNELDVFPTKEYKKHIKSLKKLGLKTIKDITESDIYMICEEIDRKWNPNTDLIHYKKQYITLRNEVLERFSNKIIKAKLLNKRCIINQNNELCCPADLISSKYKRLVETEMSIIEDCSEIPELCKLFGWDDPPSLERVIKHFCNIVKVYKTGKITIIDLLPSIDDIYGFLSEHENYVNKTLQDHFSSLGNTYIWTGDGFESPKRVYINSSDSDIDLRPFFYQLPKQFIQYHHLFCSLGCKQNIDAEMYLDTLSIINENCVNHEKSCSDTKLLKMAVDILTKVYDDHIDYVGSSEREIYFPVQNKNKEILMKPAKECTYCDADWLKDMDFDENEEVHYVHEKVHKDIAEGLGVPSLRQQMLSESDAFEEWGQEEPLTRRLRNLLDNDYVDGFSVAKELVQNADDAGAKCLKIMYDDRENNDLRTQLLCENMAELQGPAIWVYNDARFTDTDFKNITKISGGTKKSDSSTIGRFGLGFCSVYNMTDVPSLLSGSSLVMFDPHTTYLGRALPGKSPGLRINFDNERNKKLLKRLKNQFRTYDDIFDCQITTTDSAFFNGTLFRLPLRNRASDICDIVYTKEKVKRLFETIETCASNMLLFSQNVQEIELYYLSTKKNKVLDHVLMFSTSKQILSTGSDLAIPSSILKKASEMKEKGDISTQALNVLEDINIQTKSMPGRNSLFKRAEIEQIEYRWLVSWSTGTKPKTLEITRNETGALPIGAVAVPYHRSEHGYIISSLNELPIRFYQEGYFFFFLPLPISHKFQFHINGQFEVSSDRQSLRISTEGLKNVVKKEWNECIMNDAVTHALLHLLTKLRGVVDMSKYDCFHLWPTSKESVSCHMTESFYHQLMGQTLHSIFLKNKSWLDFSKCMFLETDLRHSDVGENALKTLDTLNKSVGFEVIDVPDNVYDLLMEADNTLFKSKTISKVQFYTKYFLPNIDHFNAKQLINMRDSLVKYALNINISDINTTLKKIPCIPCKPNGKLRRPSELVDEKFLQLFSDTDEFFPHVRFSKSVERLRKLGMMHDTLTNEMVLYSAKSVERLHNQSSGGAVDRSIALVDYLNAHMDHHTDIFEQLQCIHFMPIATKPEKWPFKWKLEDILETEQEVFLATKDLYHNKCMYLVGSLSLVLHHRVSERINDELAQTLGIHLDCDLETVLEQLILMAKTYDDNDPESATPHFDKIYQHLEGKPIQTEHFRHENIVWVPNTLTNVGKVSLNMTDDCSPYLFSLKNSPLKKYPLLYYSLGIEKTFQAKKYAETLQEIKEKFGENPLEESEIKIVLNLLNCFVKTNEWREFNGVIYGPDDSCILCDCKTMCFNDFDDIEKSETMRYSHPDMPMSLAKKLGVKPKLTHSMDENSEDIEDFYQEEPLVVRIQNLIEGYPCDIGVFKELIQNADDANASEIHFLLDLDKCPILNIFEGRYYKLQGPALCIFNDSSFSNNDLDGIKRLGRGNKAEDSFKTGRYGVGFNAVYNLTDVPSFLTWGGDIEKNGETLCFFDPMGRYIPGVTKQKPGKRFKDVATIRKFKNDVIKGYHENFFKDFSKKAGSVFRLPLRTQKLARDSEITKESVEPEIVPNMLDKLMMELRHIVLFLKHLFTVRITIHENGTYTERYVMKRNFIEIKRFQHFLKKQKEFSKAVSQNPEEMFNMECVNEVFDLKITESFVISQNERHCENHDFVISNSIGFKYVSEIPQFLHENIVSGKACIFPNGAVAMDKNITKEMKAFCFLPLPITTGLPVHVHGYFALDNETRRTLWHSEKESQCYKTLWNVELMKQTIAPAYASLLNFVKERVLHVHSVSSVMEFSEVSAHLRRYMSILPSDDKTSDFYWKILTYAVYKELVKQEAEFLPVLMSFKNKRRSSDVVSGKLNWTTLKTNGQTFPAYRNDDTSFSEKTNSFPDLELLDKLGLRSVTIFDDIQRTMENAKCSIGTLKPAHVIRFIASFQDDIFDRCRIEVNKNVEDTVLCNKFNVRQLLRYCLRDTDTFIANLFRMPLFLTLNGILRVLPEDEYFLVETNESFCKFFPTASGRFLMSEISGLICHKLESYQTISKGILQPFTLHKFVDLVKETDTLPCGNSIISWDKKTPTEGWIKKFWEFFYRSFSAEKMVYDDVRAQVRCYIQIIDNLPLFPVNNNQYLVNSDYLKQLVNLESFEVNLTLKRTLEKVNLMTLTEEMFESPCHSHGPNTISVFRLLCYLLPDYEHPGEIVTCLHMNAEKVQNAGLLVEEVIDILGYFVKTDVLVRSFGMDVGTQLRDLPLFVTHFNEIVSLKKYDVICLAPCDIPSDGLKELAQNSNVLFLKNIEWIEDFYVKIGIKTVSLVDIYVQYIIPKYGDMNRLAFYKHVAFLAHNSEYADNVCIQSALRDTPFILVGTSSLQVKHFFNPKYELFKRMCKNEELIPKSLRDIKTLRLLKKIGLQTTLTISLLERFTKSIAKKSQIEEQHQTAIGDSMLLLESLFRMEDDFFMSGNFSSIINIKFIKPMVVKSELSKIHPQYNPHGFICFQDSVIPDEVMVCWSSSELLPENVNVPHNETILNKLGIRKFPTFTQLVTHCKNIGVSAKQKGKSFSYECLEKVMLEVYKHLDKFRQSDDISDKEFMTLCDVPLIYLKISKDMFTPRQVVITCKENVEEIPPFITRCPMEYVHYQDLLCLMDCWKEPSCEMYASVLNALKPHVDECGQLLPKELSDAVKAQGLFFKYLTELTTVDEIDVHNIVLLNEKEGLQSARSLVINDNNIFKRKIEEDNTVQCSFLYLSDKLGDVRVDKNRLLECLKYLPERTRPCLLTAVAKLKVNLDRSFTKDTTPANELNEFLHGRDFVHGYLRLIKHALKNNNESRKWNESDEKRIAERISNTTCKHIGNIETSLIFKPVDGPRSGQELRVNCTEEKQTVHIEEKDSVATIFFDTSDNKWFNKVKMQIAVLLNKFANCCLGDVNLMILVELIELKDQQPSTISTFLDQKAIDEYESTVEINTSPLYPIPGTFVPRKWHKYLDNDYGIFQEYDFKFVALEIDDPAQEDVDNDNEDESELDSTYIFVHIIKKSENLNHFPLLQEYEINDGTETTYTVPAYRLYKFIASRSVNTDRQLVEYGGPSDSSNNSFPNDIKVAFKEVREYLNNAWKEPESVRRKLVLRLLRKWHPDKNPDNVDFCTKVFQYIQICLQRLGNGENLPDEFSDSPANKSNFSSSSTSYWSSSWFGRYWRRHRNSYRRHRTDYDDCDGFTNFSGFSWSSHQEPFPWKSEARRWYKQALSDLTCARKAWLQEDVLTYNWICYMCHQASEKCLKAAQYAIDANKIYRVKYSHDLTSLASELNSNIRALSSDLSNLTGYHTRMRYPDTLCGQNLPCDAYSKETALSVIQKTVAILEAVNSAYIN